MKIRKIRLRKPIATGNLSCEVESDPEPLSPRCVISRYQGQIIEERYQSVNTLINKISVELNVKCCRRLSSYRWKLELFAQQST